MKYNDNNPNMNLQKAKTKDKEKKEKKTKLARQCHTQFTFFFLLFCAHHIQRCLPKPKPTCEKEF